MKCEFCLPLPPTPRIWESLKERYRYGVKLNAIVREARELGALPHTPLITPQKVIFEVHGFNRGSGGHYQHVIIHLLGRSGVLADTRLISSITLYYCEPIPFGTEPHIKIRLLTKAVRWCRSKLNTPRNKYVKFHVRSCQASRTVRPRLPGTKGGVGGQHQEDQGGAAETGDGDDPDDRDRG